MKSIFTLFTVLAVTFGLSATALAQGCVTAPFDEESPAPDAYGYTWKSDSVTDGPTPNFVDISASGTQVVGLTDDNFAGPFPIGFSFPFFSNSYDEVYVGSNGYIIFGNPVNVASTAIGFPTFPTAGGPASPNNYIGMFLGDLTLTDGDGDPVPGAGVYYEEIDDSTFFISFQDVPFWTDEAPGDYRGQNNFQIILYESGNFELQYGDISQGDVHSSYAEPGVNFVTRGFEDIVGQAGSCFPSRMYPDDNTAIFVTRPSTTTYELNDLSVEYVNAEDNIGQTIFVGQAINNVPVLIKNNGTLATVPTTLQFATLDVLNENTVGNVETVTVPALNPGEEQIVDVPVTIPTDEVKLYTMQARFQGFSDDFSLNNTQRAELSVIQEDTLSNTTVLGYDRFMFAQNYGVPFWSGNQIGVQPYDAQQDDLAAGLRVGMFIESPLNTTDTFTVKSIHVGYNLNPLDAVPGLTGQYEGFRVRLYENNNGQPGQVIYADSILGAEIEAQNPLIPTGGITQEFVFALPAGQEIEVTNGGIFVSYEVIEEIDSLIFGGMITDVSGASPASFRSYEITGNVWAPYRERSTHDFSIRIGAEGLTSEDQDTTSIREAFTNSDVQLGQNRPNPAAERTVIPFTLNKPGHPTITVTNLLGQQVYSAELGRMNTGQHTHGISTADMAPGVYLYTLKVQGFTQSKRMIVSE